ncbi:mediator of RNA polymerase II transcription subunit 1-like isoform X2 [Acipenser ruthenus]|uniref:mediator of RNA polymerase II transcription subunit 1-like isoform X2 n=1 Tax=Acipenser ruthenus TaxID=7906 RepID=UPI0027419CA0|nr:mediator of RNA polymerase II transcription subunit 1-like isoform X2 [Acipenser ruthenus]
MKQETKTPLHINALMVKLRSKYAEKQWNETFNLVRRCMDKSTSGFGLASNRPLLGCLEGLQKALNVTSLTAMATRLETIAKQKGLGSHQSPTEPTCYITSDMFYLEVLMEPSGEVLDVKVAHHGEAPVVMLKNFEDFSKKLEGLSSLYHIHGDSETKIKTYLALQSLETDLMKMSRFPRPVVNTNPRIDAILHGRVGNLVPRREGNPMSIEYFITPYDQLEEQMMPGLSCYGNKVLVTVDGTSILHKLPVASLIEDSQQVENERASLFRGLDGAVSMDLPACFFLKFPEPFPILTSFIENIQRLTGISMAEELQYIPFYQLLTKAVLEQKHCTVDHLDQYFLVSLPDNHFHSYVLSQEASLHLKKPPEGALINKIPFSHPEQVPSILEILRHQSAYNTLIASCITVNRADKGFPASLHFEVNYLADSSFSVSFQHPLNDTLATVVVDVDNSRHITSKLYTTGAPDMSVNDYITKVLNRCMSIPVTMRAISRKAAQWNNVPPAITEAPILPSSTTPPPTCSYYVVSVPAPDSDAEVNIQTINPYPDALVNVSCMVSKQLLSAL